MRRVLDLRDDHFAADHTVGGREISKVDPGQYGVPVMPMTFTLEMMAEAAAVLVPGQVVTSVRDVRLYRWLAFNEEAPTVVELIARVEPRESTGGPCASRSRSRTSASPTGPRRRRGSPRRGRWSSWIRIPRPRPACPSA